LLRLLRKELTWPVMHMHRLLPAVHWLRLLLTHR
jgi:hypothetical protein